MKKTFFKRMSLLMVVVYLIGMLGMLPASASTVDELVAAGTSNAGWTNLGSIDFSTATSISPWYADEKAHIGEISDGALALWDPAYPANSNDFITLKLGNGKGNTLVYSVTYEVAKTDRPIEISMVGGGTRALIATLKYDRIDWDMNNDGAKTFITAAGGNKNLTLIVNTQDDSAAIWLDGTLLGELPLRVYTTTVGSFTHARIGAAGTTGTTAPTISKLKIYDTGLTAPLSVTQNGLIETFGEAGPLTAGNGLTWAERFHSKYGQYGSITYEEYSENDYRLKIHSNDSSIADLVWVRAMLDNNISGSDLYFSFDFAISDLPISGRNTRLINAYGSNDMISIDLRADANRTKAELYAVGSKDANGNDSPLIATDLQKQTRYNIAFEANTQTHQFNVILTRLDGTVAPVRVNNLTFRTATGSNFRTFDFTTGKVYNSIWIDNVKFSKDKDATSYGVMMLKSKTSDITVDNAAVKSSPMIRGVSASATVADLLGSLTCATLNTTISVTDSEGTVLEDAEKISGDETVVVTHSLTGKKRTYTIEAPVQPVNFYSLVVSDRQFVDSNSILLPGKATVWAAVTNSQTEEKTFYVKSVIGAATYDAQAVTVPANTTAKVKLTGDFIIPDNNTTDRFILKLYDDVACANQIGESTLPLATSTVTSMPNIFSDHMVLQRGTEVNIYGMAPTGTAISVQLGDAQAVTATAQNGEFLVKLPAMQANSVGQTLTVTAGSKTFTYNDVLIGDVFYGSGQSNMVQYYNGGYNDGQLADNAEARAWLEARANWTNVRYHAVKANLSAGTTVSTSEEPWQIVQKDDDKENGVVSYANISSVMYSVADALRGLPIEALENDVPIGVIRCAIGGTKLAAWVDTDFIEENKDLAPAYYGYFENDTTFKENGKPYGVTDLYYAMVRPMIPFNFKAAIWYQGESDNDLYTANAVSENPYTDAANAMIAMMREKMGYDLPYFIVQIPGEGSRDWSGIRLQQWKLYNPANQVYVAVTNDSGEKVGEYEGTANSIHPQDKRVVGDRLARLMAKYLYNETDVPYEAPNFRSAEVLADGSVKISLNAVGDGLHSTLVSQGEDSLPGFVLSEDGNTWKAANATISADGMNIIVSADGISAPKYISYTGVELATSEPYTYSYPMKGASTAYDTDGDSVADAYLSLAPFKEAVTESVSYKRTDDAFTANSFSCNMYFGSDIPAGAASAIIAFYNGNQLLEVGETPITVSEGTQPVTISVAVPASYTSYKVFVWSGFDAITPLVAD